MSAYTRDVLARAAMPAPAGDAARFLAALGDGQHTFQTFADSRRDARLARVLHGTLAEHGEALRRLNARGAGVFVTVNRTDGKGRKAANILVVRAYFVDLDGAPLKPVQTAPLPPHIVLESSPGRWHAYWLLAPGAPLDTFKRVQQALASRFGADLKVCDLPRVMRLPGFQHRKRKTFQTRIVELRDAAGYAHAEFIEAFGIDTACTTTTTAKVAASAPARAAHKLPATIMQGERNSKLLSLAAGFVRKGVIGCELNTRMQRINAERCTPLLGADEVDTICEHATGYGSDGFLILAHKLLDSPGWRSLSLPAKELATAALRRAPLDGTPFALPFSDFCGLRGFKNSGAFSRLRNELVRAEFLHIESKGRRSQHGVLPAMFTVPDAARQGSLRPQSALSEPDCRKVRYGHIPPLALRPQSAHVVKSTNSLCVLVPSCVPAKARTAPDTQTLAALCVLVDNRPLHIPSVADYYAAQVAA